MRRLLLFALPLLAVACSKEQANVAINVDYTPSFKTGCIVMRVQDEATGENVDEPKSFTGLADRAPPLRLGVALREGWNPKLKVTITAHEQTCTGKEVDRAELSVDLAKEGEQKPITVVFNTPDKDGDGHVAILGSGKGGTDCDDEDGTRSPSKTEICDDKDNNCVDGIDENLLKMPMFRDGDGDGFGEEAIQHCDPVAGVSGYAITGGDCKDDDATIAPGKPEVCDNIDNNCFGGVDENIDKNWYQDKDGDGAVDLASLKLQCDQPDAYIHKPQGVDFDCDDNDANNTPGKLESCDERDNNCNGVPDERFTTKNTPCTIQGVSCSGTWVCKTDFSDVECNAKPPRMFYSDRDKDGDGDSTAAAAPVCAGAPTPQNSVENLHGDCDDVDPAASSLRTEVCDAIDNNCDSVVDNTAVSCGGTLKDVADYHLSSADQDWRTVSVGLGGYPVWVAGVGGKLAVRRTAGTKFESFSPGDPTTPTPPDGSPAVHPNNCGSADWLSSWVDSNGIVFLGGPNGALAIHTGATDYTCVPGGAPTTSAITGMIGFTNGSTNTIYLTDSSGRLIRWNVGSTPAFTELNDNNLNYYGIHGLEENFLLVSGGRTGPTEQRFASYSGASSGTTASPTMHTSNPNNVGGTANAVWMGTANNACAVGDGGAVWRWDGATMWTKVNAPAGVNVDFTSVVMRYDAQNVMNPLNGQVYMVDKSSNGKLRRLTPFGWAKGPDLPLARADKPLRDIAITQTTGEFWIVGDDGRVFHYPEP